MTKQTTNGRAANGVSTSIDPCAFIVFAHAGLFVGNIAIDPPTLLRLTAAGERDAMDAGYRTCSKTSVRHHTHRGNPENGQEVGQRSLEKVVDLTCLYQSAQIIAFMCDSEQTRTVRQETLWL